jgi:hypothetical protein
LQTKRFPITDVITEFIDNILRNGDIYCIVVYLMLINAHNMLFKYITVCKRIMQYAAAPRLEEDIPRQSSDDMVSVADDDAIRCVITCETARNDMC